MGSRWLFVWLAVFTLVDSIVGSLLLKLTGDAVIAAIPIYVKYAIFAAGFLAFSFSALRGLKLYPYEVNGLLYLGLVSIIGLTILIAYPDHPAATRFHNYLFPVVIYFFGVYLSVKAKYGWRDAVGMYLKAYLFFTVALGVPVYLLGAEWFWRDLIAYGDYIVEVKGLDDVRDGLPGNFYFDPGGLRIRRFVGSLGDPLALGYSAMILLLVSWVAYPKWRYLLGLVLFALTAAALTRAALLAVIVAATFYWMFRRRAYVLLLACCALGIAVVLEYGAIIALVLGDSSTEGHVYSIIQVYDLFDPAGAVFGTLASGKQGLFEPGFMNLVFTFGGVTLLPLLLFIGGIYRRYSFKVPEARCVSLVFLAGAFTLSLFSPSFFAITSSWFGWFIAGFATRSIARARVRAASIERERGDHYTKDALIQGA